MPPDELIARLRLALDAKGDRRVNCDMVGCGTRAAAVLVPVVFQAGEARVLLTRRTEHLHHHPGQISFPGGRAEPEDHLLSVTALRETREEIGLAEERVELLGTLPTFQTGTGFQVTPFVGIVETPFTLVPDAFEVAEVFEVPLAHFLDPVNHQRYRKIINGQWREFHAMPYGDYFIWGATAAILHSLYRCVTAEI